MKVTFGVLGPVLGSAGAGLLLALACGEPAPAAAAEPKVVATVKPIHSLVAAVMSGVGTPALLIDGAASPHTFALKPSAAKALNEADVVFQVSNALESFMERVGKSLPASVRVVSLQDTPGLTLYRQRVGGTFDDEPADAGHRHGHGHGSSAHAEDAHVWLDPGNAKLMAARIAEVLAARAPEHRERFRANLRALETSLDALAADLERELGPVAGRPYIVLHDAYQYLERRYRLNAVGSVTISPDLMPSAKRLVGLRRKIASLGAVCIFAEPQLESKLIAVVTEGMNVRVGRLDPLGMTVPAGPDLYPAVMRGLAADLKSCLDGSS